GTIGPESGFVAAGLRPARPPSAGRPAKPVRSACRSIRLRRSIDGTSLSAGRRPAPFSPPERSEASEGESGEGRAAAAGAPGVGVVDREAGLLEAVLVVEDGAGEQLGARG